MATGARDAAKATMDERRKCMMMDVLRNRKVDLEGSMKMVLKIVSFPKFD